MRQYVVGLRLYGRGGLAVSPLDLAILRQVFTAIPGMGQLTVLEDVRDVEMTLALERDDALAAYGALISGLCAAVGSAAWRRNVTTLNLKILEV